MKKKQYKPYVEMDPDKMLNSKMYYEKGIHQHLLNKQLTAYTLKYGMDINFISNKGFLGFGRQIVKKTLLSKPIRAGVVDVWVYFRPERKEVEEIEEDSYYEDQSWRDE